MSLKSKLRFYRGKGRPWIGRTITIERELSAEVDKDFKDFPHSEVPCVIFVVEWESSDRRDESIREGRCREQSVVVEARKVLMVLREMFPEMEITFKVSEKSEGTDDNQT